MLATGKRDYVLVDAYGGMHALPKLIEDKAVRTKDVRARLAAAYPIESLPTVEEAQALVSKHRQQADVAQREEQFGSRLTALKHQQAERQALLDAERTQLRARQQQARTEQMLTHQAERTALGNVYRQTAATIRREREVNRPRGLAGFLAEVSGVALVRRVMQRRDDARRLASHIEERKNLRAQQLTERRALDQRIAFQDKEAERRLNVQKRVDARELAAFLRDEKREQRIKERGDNEVMPSLRAVQDEKEKATQKSATPDLLASFSHAKDRQTTAPPDLLDAFTRAAREPASDRAGTDDRTVDIGTPDNDIDSGSGPKR